MKLHEVIVPTPSMWTAAHKLAQAYEHAWGTSFPEPPIGRKVGEVSDFSRKAEKAEGRGEIEGVFAPLIKVDERGEIFLSHRTGYGRGRTEWAIGDDKGEATLVVTIHRPAGPCLRAGLVGDRLFIRRLAAWEERHMTELVSVVAIVLGREPQVIDDGGWTPPGEEEED